jgi:hypothetical protein
MAPTMNRRLRRWLSILVLGALAFSQATLVVAACAMDRSELAQVLTAPAEHDCCEEMAANGCVSHTTSDLQVFANPLPLAMAPTQVVPRGVPASFVLRCSAARAARGGACAHPAAFLPDLISAPPQGG